MADRQKPATRLGTRGQTGKARAVAAILVAYAVVAPVVISVVLALRAAHTVSPLLGTAALILALAGPVVTTVLTSLRGFDTVVDDLVHHGDSEPQQAVVRILMAGAVLLYLGALAIADVGDGAVVPMLAADVPAIFCSWLLLVHLLVRPQDRWPRRAAAMMTDVAFISIFLHVGGPFAAPWFSLYLWVALGFGFRFGIRALAACASLAVLGFGAVFASTPFWYLQTATAVGIFLALILLPAYAATLIRRLLNAKAQAEEASAAKGRFLAVMSHELRTPLNSLLGIGSLIARTGLDPEQREMVATIQLSARSLLGLIDDLLDFSKLDAGRVAAPVESFLLHEVMTGAVAMLRPDAEAKGLALVLRIDPRLPQAYRGSPAQLRQVLTNLIGNAVKFTPKGEISIAATFVSRSGPTVELRLEVRDQGVGILPEALGRIFEAFAQADETVTRQFGGTGLGLAIARQLVELMGGTIDVESTIGKGSTFIVRLALDHDASVPARAPDLAGRCILIIAADAGFAATIEAILRGWHADPSWYSDGETAVAALVQLDPAGATLLLIDGRDNAMAALSLTHRIATLLPRQPFILFIASAADSDPIALIAGTRLGAILEAPVTEAALANALIGALAGEVAPSLPVAATAAAETPAGGLSAGPTLVTTAHPLRVLVADDNASNCKILKTTLELAGHQVVVAAAGAAALERLGRDHFDVALLDVNMPEVTGPEVARRYRQGHTGEARLPIIALTADATSETEQLCRDAGMDAVITKPVEAGQLVALIDEIYVRVAMPARAVVGAARVVTPISIHPRFEPSAVVDEATIAALLKLGGPDFVIEVVDTFRKDAAKLIDRLRHAADKADLRDFREILHSLRSGGANIGAVRLCQSITSLRDVTARDLRHGGTEIVDKIDSEVIRLDAALEQLLLDQR